MTRTAGPEIVLDLSRLVSRLRHATPTGVDRVEMAYAAGLLRRVPDRLAFGALHPVLGYGRIPRVSAERFLAETERRWEGASAAGRPNGAAVAAALALTRPRPVPRGGGARVLVQSSPHHLDRPGVVRRILAREQARYLVLLHDLIPIQFPEYARPGGLATHLARVRTVAALADGVVANSAATWAAFAPYLVEAGRRPASAVALLGTERPPPVAPAASGGRPYFVCLGTIEPRKNHLLLLHAWRRMAEELGAAATPRLLILGRRGWENEQVVDLLERSPALAGCVEEHAHLPDREVRRLVAGARAVLLPSFAEGFGMPVPEALALGVPVICSDLPALREAGGGVPLHLDPLDGPAWMRAVLDMTGPRSAERAAQLERLAGWTPPGWGDHLDAVLGLADRIA